MSAETFVIVGGGSPPRGPSRPSVRVATKGH